MSIRGIRGVNRLDFRGRIRRKAVRPGVYLLTVTLASSRLPVVRPLLVQVVSPRRTILLGEARAPRAVCDAASGFVARERLAASAPALALMVTPFDPPARRPAPAGAARAVEPGTSMTPPQRNDDVLGVRVDLPALPRPEEGQLWALMGALLLVGLPLLVMLALVVRFLRGSWNPG